MAQQLDCNLSTQPSTDFLGQNGTLRFFENARGQRIAQYYWPAATQKPRAVIHLVHGHGTYLCFQFLRVPGVGQLPLYRGSWVETLNQAGYSVTGIDAHGSGRSEGLKAYCEKFDHLVDDILTHTELCSSSGLPGFPPTLPAGQQAQGVAASVPAFICGTSLGGCLSLYSSLRKPGFFSGVILLAAMISLDKVSKRGLNPYLRPLGSLVSMLAPTLPVAKTSKNEKYPNLQAEYEGDSNNWTTATRARNAMEYLNATAALMEPGGLERATDPLLIFHGTIDDMCDIDGSKALHARAASQDKSLHLMDGMWHVLTKEPGNDKVLDIIIQWCNERSPKPQATPAPSASAAHTSSQARPAPTASQSTSVTRHAVGGAGDEVESPEKAQS